MGTHDQTISACNALVYVFWMVRPGVNFNVFLGATHHIMRFHFSEKRALLNANCPLRFAALDFAIFCQQKLGPSEDALHLDWERTCTCWNPLCEG